MNHEEKCNLRDILIGLLVPAILTSIGIVIEPIRNEFIQFLNNYNFKELTTCNILIFGRGASGKTTLITSWRGGKAIRENRTVEFQALELIKRPIRQENGKDLDVKAQLFDYEGQRAPAFFDDLPKKSEWYQNEKFIIHALIFLIDITENRDQNFHSLSDETVFEDLKSNHQDKFKSRLSQHREYINEGTIVTIFNRIDLKKLYVIKLVINKIDLVEELIERKHIKNYEINSTPEKNISFFFKNLENRGKEKSIIEEKTISYLKNLEDIKHIEFLISNACAQNQVIKDKFSISFISALKDKGVRKLLTEILETHLKQEKKIKGGS